MEIQTLSSLFLEYSYAAVFGVLLLCGLGLPVPEEITLIAAGVAVFEGRAELVPMICVTVVGILAGDCVLLYWGRRYGPALLEKKIFRKLLHADRMAKVRRQFELHGSKAVFFARFFAGIRPCAYFTAGTLGMRFRTFVLLDLVGALLSAPISVWLGCRFGAEIEQLLTWVREGERLLFLALVIVLAVVFTRHWRSKVAAQKVAGASRAEAPPPATPEPAPREPDRVDSR